MPQQDPEKLLEKLRKLSANRKCADCGKENRFGFESVCVKYGIFVCSNCKSAHQAYSHRVKHIRMSTWTLSEVEALRMRNKGGNEYNRAVWYAKMSPEVASRLIPNEGDRLEKHKDLILQVYEHQKYFDESAGQALLQARKAQTAPPPPNPRQGDTSGPNLIGLDPAPVGNKPVEPSTDLFSQLNIVSNPGVASVTQQTAPVASTSDTFDPFGDTPSSHGGGLLDIQFPATGTSQPTVAQPVAVSGSSQSGSFAPFNGSSTVAANVSQFPQPPVQNMAQHGQFGMPSNSSTGDPFAMLHSQPPQRQYIPQQPTQQQFIHVMAQATGDPFAGLHMKGPPQQPRNMPRGAPMPPSQGIPMGGGVPVQQQRNQAGMMGFQQQPGPNALNDPFAGLQ